jgi:aminopeptidase
LGRFQHAPRDTFEEIPTWQVEGLIKGAKAGGGLLGFNAVNPEFLKAQDPKLVATVQHTRARHLKPVYNLIDKRSMNWSGITAPVEGWTEKMFHHLPIDIGRAKLLDIIFDICGVNDEDRISAWQQHINQLKSRREYLNEKQYTTLKYTAPGTNLTVGLPRGHIWRAAS